MQMHHYRSEHWVVVHGTKASIAVGGEARARERVPIHHRHPVASAADPGKTTLEIIEVQSGDYLGNAGDIVRGDDAYNRAPEELSSLGFHETFWLFPNEADSALRPD